MNVTLVEKIDWENLTEENGRVIDVSKLEDKPYDLRVKLHSGGRGAYNGASLEGVKSFVQQFGHIGPIYASPSQPRERPNGHIRQYIIPPRFGGWK